MNLKPTINKLSRYTTQIIHFKGGDKLTFEEIDTETIKQGQFTKFKLKDGRYIMVNDKNVNAIEVFKIND
jgi:hypothetical protein